MLSVKRRGERDSQLVCDRIAAQRQREATARARTASPHAVAANPECLRSELGRKSYSPELRHCLEAGLHPATAWSKGWSPPRLQSALPGRYQQVVAGVREWPMSKCWGKTRPKHTRQDKAVTGLSTGVGADGGALVQPGQGKPAPKKKALDGDVQAVVVPKQRYADRTEAARQVEHLGYDSHDIRESVEAWVFNQYPPEEVREGTDRVVETDGGCRLIVGKRGPAQGTPDHDAGETPAAGPTGGDSDEDRKREKAMKKKPADDEDDPKDLEDQPEPAPTGGAGGNAPPPEDPDADPLAASDDETAEAADQDAEPEETADDAAGAGDEDDLADGPLPHGVQAMSDILEHHEAYDAYLRQMVKLVEEPEIREFLETELEELESKCADMRQLAHAKYPEMGFDASGAADDDEAGKDKAKAKVEKSWTSWKARCQAKSYFPKHCQKALGEAAEHLKTAADHDYDELLDAKKGRARYKMLTTGHRFHADRIEKMLTALGRLAPGDDGAARKSPNPAADGRLNKRLPPASEPVADDVGLDVAALRQALGPLQEVMVPLAARLDGLEKTVYQVTGGKHGAA